MRLAILLAAMPMACVSVMADAIRITSPNHPQTFAYGEMIWHQLYLDAAGELAARIVFSNYLMSAMTSRAVTNRSTFVFQVSDSFLHDGLSLQGVAEVN